MHIGYARVSKLPRYIGANMEHGRYFRGFTGKAYCSVTLNLMDD